MPLPECEWRAQGQPWFRAITFAAVNDQPPSVALALPSDFVRLLMQDIGLGARESGLSAMIARLKRFAMQSAETFSE